MDKCLQHSRHTVGPCMWCGKKLCDKCVAHQEGGKLYCDKCFGHLNPFSRIHLPKQTTVQKQGEQPWISKPSEKSMR